MSDGLFLVAHLECAATDEELSWLAGNIGPYQAVDPIDFLIGDEITAIYEMYRSQYGGIDERLNIPMPEALLEFNRWIVLRTADGEVAAFAGFKTTEFGLKLGLAATDGQASSKAALKALLRGGLNVPGVYAEVSGGLERALAGRVLEVDASRAEVVLRKELAPDDDGKHYTREIANVGPRRKLLVGRPRN